MSYFSFVRFSKKLDKVIHTKVNNTFTQMFTFSVLAVVFGLKYMQNKRNITLKTPTFKRTHAYTQTYIIYFKAKKYNIFA